MLLLRLMKTTRAFAIAQLCIAFTILLWHLSQPFVGDLFRAKAQILVFEEAMKDRVRYEGLPEEDRLLIAEGYDRAQRQIGLPFTTKLEQSFSGLIYKVSPYELAWIVLSIVLPILLLKQVDGARLAVWLIPLMSILYVVDNQYYGVEMGPTAHERLFPSEEELVRDYMDEPLGESLGEQHAQLKGAWERYVAERWGDGYAFNAARGVALVERREERPQAKEGVLLCWAIVVWNLLFALGTTGKKKDNRDNRDIRDNRDKI